MRREHDSHVKAFRNCRVSTPEKQREAFYDMLERQATKAANASAAPKFLKDTDRGPTPYREAMANGEVETVVIEDKERRERVSTMRLLDGSVLDMLVARNTITGDQYHAGAQFYADWYHSGLAASGVIDPMKEHVDGATSVHESDRRLDAMTRYKEAVKALGMTHGIVMQCIVLAEESLAEFGRRRYGHKADKLAKVAATAALKDALDELDQHYHGRRRQRPSHAHAPGYRPSISLDTRVPGK